MVTKLNGIVSHRTLLSQLDFIENPDEELELIAKEKQEYINQLDIYSNPVQQQQQEEEDEQIEDGE